MPTIKTDNRLRRDSAEIKKEIREYIEHIHQCFADNSKVIDGSKFNSLLKPIGAGLGHNYITLVRQHTVVKNSYTAARKMGHDCADGKRGVYYTLKKPLFKATKANATKIYEYSTALTQNIYRKIRGILSVNAIERYSVVRDKRRRIRVLVISLK